MELAGPEGIFLELGADSAVDSGFLIGNTHRTNGLFDRKTMEHAENADGMRYLAFRQRQRVMGVVCEG